MKKLAILASCLCFTAPAVAQSVAETSGVNSAMGLTPTTADFVTEVAFSDMFEIQSSRLADQKLRGPIRTFADRMIADHIKTSNDLKSMVQDGHIEASLPTNMSSSQEHLLDQLQQAQGGSSFATAYQKAQVSAHEDAVSLFERYADGGANVTLKMWAIETLPILKERLRIAKTLSE